MNRTPQDKAARVTAAAEVEHASPSEVLSLPRKSLTVRHSEELTLQPADPQYRDHFRRVTLQRFADLQALMLIPQGLREDKVLAAMRADDEDALAISDRQLSLAPAPCGCSDAADVHADAHGAKAASAHAGSAKRDYANNMQSAYRRVRAMRHKALARELGDAQGRPVAWDSLDVRMTYGLVRRQYEISKVDVLVALLQDITVFNNSTLNLYPTTGLYANHVRIHVDGKIKSTSSFLKFFCVEFAGNLP